MSSEREFEPADETHILRWRGGIGGTVRFPEQSGEASPCFSIGYDVEPLGRRRRLEAARNQVELFVSDEKVVFAASVTRMHARSA